MSIEAYLGLMTIFVISFATGSITAPNFIRSELARIAAVQEVRNVILRSSHDHSAALMKIMERLTKPNDDLWTTGNPK